MEEQIFLG